MPTDDNIKSASTRIDPIRLELIKNAPEMNSDNMMVSVLRTSRSTFVKANMDCSASICDAHGTMVAQGLALPALAGCLDYFGDDIAPGESSPATIPTRVAAI